MEDVRIGRECKEDIVLFNENLLIHKSLNLDSTNKYISDGY